MSTFYRVMEILGLVGSVWVFGLIWWAGVPGWTWGVTIPAFVLIEFGCFANRDRKHIEQLQEVA